MNNQQAQRIQREYVSSVAAKASDIFPLLCPVREYDWIDGWSCDMIYSDSGFAEYGCIFRTNFPRGIDEIWVVSRYEPENFIIQFVIVAPDSHVMKMDLSLEETGQNITNLKWVHTFTALTEKGRAFMHKFGDNEYAEMMSRLSESLNHFCQTGRMLKK